MRSIIVSILLCALSALHAQPTSRSSFFVANEGQWPGEFAFRYDGGGGSWYVTDQGMTIDLKQYERDPLARKDFNTFAMHDERENKQPTRIKGHVLKANLVRRAGSPTLPELIGTDKLSSYSNYFYGQDKSKWRSRVGHYRKVIAKEVWPGIDVEYEAKKQGVETFFRVQPGADISQIQIEYEGLNEPLSVDSKGNLVLKTSLGSLIEKAPFAYQIENHRQREVSVHFELANANSYTLNVPNYNHDRELVIDPLLYGTYLGGGGEDIARDIDVDSTGAFVVCGGTHLVRDFPVTPGAYQMDAVGSPGIVSRFNEDGSDLVFSTYLGTPHFSNIVLRAVCFDHLGRVICSGGTDSHDWPVTDDAIQSEYNAGSDATLNILSADGTELVYGTYLGGEYYDTTRELLCSPDGILYCCGEASGGENHFPTTPDAVYPDFPGDNQSGAFLLMFDLSTLTLAYSTAFPQIWYSITSANALYPVEPGIVWMAGITSASSIPLTPNAIQAQSAGPFTGFITLWNINNNELSYCSYWGGEDHDSISDIDIISDSLIVLSGMTKSSTFPTTEGVLEPVDPDTTGRNKNGFVTIINPFESVIASTLFGVESCETSIPEVKADSNGISFFGMTWCNGIPLSPDAVDTLYNDGVDLGGDFFVARLSPDLRILEYGSYLGGAGYDEVWGGCFDREGNAWLCGETGSADLPTTEGAFDREQDAFLDCFIISFQIPDLDTPVSIHPIVPEEYSLSIFPNPFNPSTTISFNLPHRARTSLEIFNLLGQSVYSIDLGQLEAGQHQHHLNAASLPSGSYLTRLDAGNVQDVKRMVLVR